MKFLFNPKFMWVFFLYKQTYHLLVLKIIFVLLHIGRLIDLLKIKINFGTAFTNVIARPISQTTTYYNDAFDENFNMQGTIGGKLLWNPR